MALTIQYTIYLHIHIESGKGYIGLTKKSIMRRWKEHVWHASSKSHGGCRHFWNAIRKYGEEAFSHHMIMQLDEIEEGNRWEAFWIDFFDTRNPKKGFNLVDGGRCKPHHIHNNPWLRPGFGLNSLKNLEKGYAASKDPQNIAKLIARNKALVLSSESRSKIRKSNQSRIVKPETLQKLSAAGIGRKLSPDRAQKLREMGSKHSAFLKSRTHCKHGHSLEDAYIRKSDNERICKICSQLRSKRRRNKKQALNFSSILEIS